MKLSFHTITSRNLRHSMNQTMFSILSSSSVRPGLCSVSFILHFPRSNLNIFFKIATLKIVNSHIFQRAIIDSRKMDREHNKPLIYNINSFLICYSMHDVKLCYVVLSKLGMKFSFPCLNCQICQINNINTI